MKVHAELQEPEFFLECKYNSLMSIKKYLEFLEEKFVKNIPIEYLHEVKKDFTNHNELYGKSSVRYLQLFGGKKFYIHRPLIT
jgi:hypothetical protein